MTTPIDTARGALESKTTFKRAQVLAAAEVVSAFLALRAELQYQGFTDNQDDIAAKLTIAMVAMASK